MTPPLPPAQANRAFAVLLATAFMTMLDISIVNVALPSIEASLGAANSQLQWIVAGYTLAFGLTLVPAGRIGDVVGRRTVFLVGVTWFLLGSAACGLAPSAGALAISRLLQGMGAAVINPQVIGILQQLFQGPRRARAFGYFGMIVGVSTAIGPVLGGALITVFGSAHGWRAVFLINLPIGFILMLGALRELPRTQPRTQQRTPHRLSLDILGLVLLAFTVLTTMYPFVAATEAGPRGLASAPWWILGAALAFLALFILWERLRDRRGHPVVMPSTLTQNRSFLVGMTLGGLFFSGFTSLFVVFTLYLQQGMAWPAWLAGLAQVPHALMTAVSSWWAGRAVVRFGRRLYLGGLLVVILGLAIIIIANFLFPADIAAYCTVGATFLTGLGTGCVITPNQTLTLHEVPLALGGTAGGLLQTTQQVGSSIGMTAVTLVFFTTLAAGEAGLPPAALYSHGIARALLVSLTLMVLALAVAFADTLRRGRSMA